MRLPAALPSSLPTLALLALLLAAPLAHGQAGPDASDPRPSLRARGAPVALRLLPARLEAPAEQAPPHLEAEAPVSPAAWAAHGAMSLVPLGAVYGASRVGEERLWVTAAETVAGGVAGSLPAGLLFLHPAEAGGRWTELDVAAFGTGLVLTPPVAALGTWGLGELAFDGSQQRGRAYLGALGGAAVGTLLAVAVHGFLEEVVDDRESLEQVRKVIGLGFIGAGATIGYQWGGGGPRSRER